MTEHLVEDADALAQSVAAMVRARPGRLVALTVTVPPGQARAVFTALLEERLAIAGIDLVDITATVQPGPPRAISMEFER